MSEEPAIFVITDANEIDTFAREVVGVEPTVPDQRQRFVDRLRELDYERNFAVLVLQEWKGSGGYGTTIEQVVRQGDRVIVRAAFTSPGKREPVPAVITEPYHLIAVPKDGISDQLVQFELVANGRMVAKTSHFITLSRLRSLESKSIFKNM